MEIRSDLPIKYYLNLHGEKSIRDNYYFLFEILQYVIKTCNQKQKELTEENLKFSSSSLKYIFGDKLKEEPFKSELVESLKELLKSEYLKSSSNFMYFTQKAITRYYKIND